MGLDTNYQYDSGDAPDTSGDMSANDAFSPGAQAAMSDGLDDPAADAPNPAPATDTPSAPSGTAPDQPADPTSIQPHIGGMIENDINKEAEHQPIWTPKGETEGKSPEPPEGWHPGVEGGW